jgi:hypothetical protein
MSENVTIVTALYDINRGTEGDGRTIDDYFDWFKKTLSLNARFVVFIQDSLYQRYEDMLETISNKQIVTYVTSLEDVPYYKYKDRMDTILHSDEYKRIISVPTRIECKMSLYNVLQYSKLDWIKQAISNNPHNTEHFFWMDAGCSRFFENIDIAKPYLDLSKLQDDKILVQGRNDIYHYSNWEILYRDCVNLICGTFFGGSKTAMLWLCEKINDVFNELLDNNIVNNEQIAMALIWKQYQDKFQVYINNTNLHLPLFTHLSYS